jgi:ATP-dependent exoDNAse (exonuclease V) beta subunit
MPDAPLRDAAARNAVRTQLDRTIFLEAGAGSGKTSCLVDRFVALVDAGVPADAIAAITFTEKAAGELVDRIRARLDEGARDGSDRCRGALDVIDRAAVGTLHSFAQRVLTEHPIEAGLPPRISVLDEIASQVAFEARWDAFREELLDDPAMASPLRLLLAGSADLDDLHDVAVAFEDNWDLVDERVHGPWRPPPIPTLTVDDLVARLDAVVARAAECRVEGDRLLDHLRGTVTDVAQRLRGAIDDDTRFSLLQTKVHKHAGDKRNWGCDPAAIRDELAAIDREFEGRRNAVQEAVLQVLASRIAEFTVAGADGRRRAGELEFHDLLVLARAVVRDADRGPGVRRALAERYQRLLLDEFQDTDPIQVELAVLIASDDPDAAAHRWSDVKTEPGRLFFVGDPKQSIYRFRRADIRVFLEARDDLVGDGETLTSNFRTVEPIVHWVNHTFGELIEESPGSQPAYVSLDARRRAPEVGPPVLLTGAFHDISVNADGLRDAEARDVVTAVCRAMSEKWSVGDERDEWRAPRWRDIAVLVPARTSLPFLEAALDAADVPYRVETSSLVYGTREVRDLLQIARAVDDPTDGLAVVAALRTPGFGVGDDDLFTWRTRHHGRWDHQGRLPEGAPADHPVALGLQWLGRLHRERHWLAPSAVLERIVRDRRVLELAVEERRPRDLWRRIRFVLDQCRAWEEAGGQTLRQYLRWAEGQSAEGVRVVETVLPESDDDAVRILTVHGAKGLEFPIVILSGMTTELRSRGRGVEVRFPETESWAIKLRKGVSTADFDATKPIDEQMDHHERLRLLYVAATRARDHLVVSVHRKDGKRTAKTSAEVLWDAGSTADGVELFTAAPDDDPPRAPRALAPAGEVMLPPLPTLHEWRDAHDAALAAATRPIATSATRLAEEAARAKGDPGLDKGPRDLELPPWQKGRYGTAIGRAVHGVLQVVDLGTGDGLRETCASQAAAERVLGREDVIERLARAALDSTLVRRVASRAFWREVYVGVPWGDDGVLEGYVDLLYRDDDGLVVVDYKTDAWGSEADLDAKVERYSVQLQAYASALTTAVGEPIVRAVLLFLGEARAVERQVTLTA